MLITYQGGSKFGFSEFSPTIRDYRIVDRSNGFSRDAIERQLSHSERDKVRDAYNAADFMVERRKMMQWWSDYLTAIQNGE